MSDDRSERYRAPALDKGLDILELLARQPGGLTRAEIVKATGRGASEIFRMIERLVARDYVSRSAEGDRYALTMKLFHLGAVYPPLHRLVTAAQPVMDGFAARAMQSVHLVIVDQDKARVVAHASSPSTWEFRLRVGATLDLFTTGSGLVLLALQDPAKARAMPGVNLAPARPVPPELDVELARIRADGYRVGDSLQLAGASDITVPVTSIDNGTVAVLTCPYLPRFGEDGSAAVLNVKDTLNLLRDCAARVSVT